MKSGQGQGKKVDFYRGDSLLLKEYFRPGHLAHFFVDPKIYTLDEHRIPPEKIDPQAFYVIQKLKEAGHKAYLVGGGVRDLLLNQRPKDFDVSTSAKPEEIKMLFRSAILIGRRFRLAHVRFGKKVIEVSTFRSGDIERADLILRDNQWGTEEEDVLRRDFTINGLFYDPQAQIVIDYVGGYPDLGKKMLRAIGPPEARFTQDPVRMIRLIKFCARFDFEIERPTLDALLSCKGEIVKSSSARIFEELLRMLESGSSKPFFHLLNQYGLLASLLPELAHFLEMRSEDLTFALLGEIDQEVRKDPSQTFDRSLLLSALIFPLFDEYIKERSKAHRLHLGQIGDEARHAIDCIFSHFFKLPRRMRGIMSFLLTLQYRLIPLEPQPGRRMRIPKDPFFPLALQLLKLRAAVQADLLPQYTLWTESYFAVRAGAPLPQPPAPQRRRRKWRQRSHGA